MGMNFYMLEIPQVFTVLLKSFIILSVIALYFWIPVFLSIKRYSQLFLFFLSSLILFLPILLLRTASQCSVLMM